MEVFIIHFCNQEVEPGHHEMLTDADVLMSVV